MFYSPSKEFVRFSTYRTEEIKALRERIHKEKVTSEQIESTQLRLERLRQDYEQLQTEPVKSTLIQCSELKQVFHNSERAIDDLLKQKSLSEKELAYAKQQFEELERRRIELQDRGAQLEEQLRAQNSEKDKLVEVKVER
jgi:chromosome segregation ATPase